jgi:hypothetical protein
VFPNCPDDGWTVGTSIHLKALSSFRFTGWTGDIVSSSADMPITFDADHPQRRLTANFTVTCDTLTLNAARDISADPGPNCPDVPASSNRYVAGTPVFLGARNRANDSGGNGNGYAFDNFSITGQANQGTPTQIVVDRDMTVNANYHERNVGEVLVWLGNETAIGAKKAVGFLAAVATSALQSLAISYAYLAVAASKGVVWILQQAGVQGSGLALSDHMIDNMQQSLDLLFAPLKCAQEWAHGSPPAPPSGTGTTDQLAALGSTYTPAAVGPGKALAETAFPTQFLKYKKFMPIVGALFTLGQTLYSDISDPHWESSAQEAWTGGGDQYKQCLQNSLPTGAH